ncbi:MAG: diguanylate cyclase [Gammaproteobacteria bacterium]|nr:diguanylate cyclase [Gammaproteobacteria bacterium]
MEVRRKIWLIPTFSALIFVVFIISMLAVFMSSQSVSDRVESLNTIYMPFSQHVSKISANLNGLQDAFEETVLLGDKRALEKAKEYAEEINHSIDEMQVISQHIVGLNTFHQMFHDYNDVAGKLSLDLLDKDMSQLSAQITRTALLRNQLEAYLVNMQEQVKTEFHNTFEESQSELQRVTTLVLILVGLMTALLGGGSFILVRNFSTRLQMVLDFARNVEGGNYEVSLKENWNDEFSILMRALNAMANSIKSSTDKLNVLANTDALTGIYNRHALMLRLNEEFHSVSRHGHKMSVCMCDIDRFKGVNDTHGHHVGDRIISEFANCVRDGLRTEDVVGRYGGDEFFVILPYTDQEKAYIAIERIRKRWESMEFRSDDDKTFKVTGSFGIAQMRPGMTVEDLMQTADNALYTAKSGGRNRVELAGDDDN